jgi:tetratricopeptide (TPR) repeat protein
MVKNLVPLWGLILSSSLSCLAQTDTTLVRKLTTLAHSYVNSNVDSLKYFSDKSLELSISLNDLTGISESHANLGDYYWLNGDYGKALDEFEISKRVAEQIPNQRLASDATSGIAIIYQNLGLYAKAIEFQIQLIKIAEKKNDTNGLSRSYSNLGVAYKENGMYIEALIAYRNSIPFSTQINKVANIAGAYANIGETLMLQNKFDSALLYLRKGLHLFDSLKIDRGKIICFNTIGDLFLSTGNLDSAFKYRSNAYVMSGLSSLLEHKTDALTGMGDISRSRKNYSDAIGYYSQGIQIARERHMNNYLPALYLGMANSLEATQKFEESLQYLNHYVNLRDSLFNAESIKQISNLKIGYDVEKKEASIALLEKNAKIQELNRDIIIICGSGVFFFFVLIFRRQRLINKKEKELLKAGFEKKLLEVSALVLRAQLNPHFIFNSMNSINSYIQKSEIKEASDFLTKFAKLMRMILENSQNTEISFEEDLNLLTLYLEIEKKRSEGMFDFLIEVAEELDVKKIKIPTLLAQPFVENSIWHAFVRDKPGNLVKVVYTLEKGMVVCRVIDNGQGRKNSAHELSANLQRRSFGINISKERLKILTNDPDQSFIDIEDFEDEKGVGNGTQVTIKIPLESRN